MGATTGFNRPARLGLTVRVGVALATVAALRVGAQRYISSDWNLGDYPFGRGILEWSDNDLFKPGLEVALITLAIAFALSTRPRAVVDPGALAGGALVGLFVYPIVFVPSIHDSLFLGSSLLLFAFAAPPLAACMVWLLARVPWARASWPTRSTQLLLAGSALCVIALFLPLPVDFASPYSFGDFAGYRGIDKVYPLVAASLTVVVAVTSPRFGRAGSGIALAWGANRAAWAYALVLRGDTHFRGPNWVANAAAILGAVLVSSAALRAGTQVGDATAAVHVSRDSLRRLGVALVALTAVAFAVAAHRYMLGGDITFVTFGLDRVKAEHWRPRLASFADLAPGYAAAVLASLFALTARSSQIASGAALAAAVGLFVYPTMFVLPVHDKGAIGSGLLAIAYLLPLLAAAGTLVVLETGWTGQQSRFSPGRLLLGAAAVAGAVGFVVPGGALGGRPVDLANAVVVVVAGATIAVVAPRLGRASSGIMIGWGAGRAAWAIGLTRIDEPSTAAVILAALSSALFLAAGLAEWTRGARACPGPAGGEKRRSCER